MNGERPGVVFDCNVLLQAALSEEGPAAECLRRLDQNRITVYISRPTLRELRGVLAYPAIRHRNPGLTDRHAATFVDRLMFKATLVRRVRHVIDYPRAVQDEPYIDLAATVKADYLVTRDRDLLSLMTGHANICKEFRQKTSPLRIVDPISFLSALSSPSGELR